MHAQREAYRAAYRAFFRDWDILVAPIVMRSAFPHIQSSWPPDPNAPLLRIEIDDKSIQYSHQFVYPALATLSGQPATAFPVGLSTAGLPMGLQAIGPYLEDRTTIRFASLVAVLTGGFKAPPRFTP
jgi:amidase